VVVSAQKEVAQDMARGQRQKTSTEHDHQGADDQGETLELRALLADPLLLLNAPEEQVRQLFETRLKKPAEVRTALALVAAFRRVFEALATDEPVLGTQDGTVAELREAADRLDKLWAHAAPHWRPRLAPGVWEIGDWPDTPLDKLHVSLRLMTGGRPTPIWAALSGPPPDLKGNVWDNLWTLFQQPVHHRDYRLCQQCGAIFPRRRGPVPRFCSSACRAKAWRERH